MKGFFPDHHPHHPITTKYISVSNNCCNYWDAMMIRQCHFHYPYSHPFCLFCQTAVYVFSQSNIGCWLHLVMMITIIVTDWGLLNGRSCSLCWMASLQNVLSDLQMQYSVWFPSVCLFAAWSLPLLFHMVYRCNLIEDRLPHTLGVYIVLWVEIEYDILKNCNYVHCKMMMIPSLLVGYCFCLYKTFWSNKSLIVSSESSKFTYSTYTGIIYGNLNWYK